MRFEAHSVGKTQIDESKRVVIRRQDFQGVDFSGRKLIQFSSVG